MSIKHVSPDQQDRGITISNFETISSFFEERKREEGAVIRAFGIRSTTVPCEKKLTTGVVY